MLPVDTNVRRCRSAPASAFDGACAQALFDLGATICLARIPRCGVCPLAAVPFARPRYEPLRKQSAFEGSFRQRRASRCARSRRASSRPTATRSSLARDGLVVLEDGRASLPA